MPNSHSIHQAMNGYALRKRLKYIASQTHQKEQAMLF